MHISLLFLVIWQLPIMVWFEVKTAEPATIRSRQISGSQGGCTMSRNGAAALIEQVSGARSQLQRDIGRRRVGILDYKPGSPAVGVSMYP